MRQECSPSDAIGFWVTHVMDLERVRGQYEALISLPSVNMLQTAKLQIGAHVDTALHKR